MNRTSTIAGIALLSASVLRTDGAAALQNPRIVEQQRCVPASPRERDVSTQGLIARASASFDALQTSWSKRLVAEGHSYVESRLVPFLGVVASACGLSEPGDGTFYCPADQSVYVDLDAFRELRDQVGPCADDAQAAVIAHELGHHVQWWLGLGARGLDAQDRAHTELHADCLAGAGLSWHGTRGAARLRYAAALGAVSSDPAAGTHGSRALRLAWFEIGFHSGSAAACNGPGAID